MLSNRDGILLITPGQKNQLFTASWEPYRTLISQQADQEQNFAFVCLFKLCIRVGHSIGLIQIALNCAVCLDHDRDFSSGIRNNERCLNEVVHIF
jgi:hypothetical protein